MTFSRSARAAANRVAFVAALACAILFFVPLVASAAHPKIDLKSGWKPLFNGKDLSGWAYPEGSWAVENGVIARRGGGFLTSVDQYGDFILDLEFKLHQAAAKAIRDMKCNDYLPLRTS